MKKLILVTSLSVWALFVSAQATESGFIRAEISAGVFGMNDGLITDLEYNQNYNYNSGYSDGPWGNSDNSSVIFFADLSFFKYKRMEVGINLGFQQLSTNKATYGQPDPVTSMYPTESATINIFHIMPELRINWITSGDNKFEMYSGASFGLSFIHEDYTINSERNESFKQPSVHINGLGLRFGDKFGGFFEVGVGARGIMSCGLSYRP